MCSEKVSCFNGNPLLLLCTSLHYIRVVQVIFYLLSFVWNPIGGRAFMLLLVYVGSTDRYASRSDPCLGLGFPMFHERSEGAPMCLCVLGEPPLRV